MNSYSNHQSPYPPPGGGKASGAAQSKKNSYKKGLGFVQSSIARAVKDPISELLNTQSTNTKEHSSDNAEDVSIHPSGSTIPLINLDQLSEGSSDDRRRLVQAFGIGLTQVGCVAVEIEYLTPLIEQVYSEMRRYFHQPLEMKILDWQGCDRLFGYSPQGNQTEPIDEKADIKESFFISKNFNQWPSQCRSFSRVMSEYHTILAEYAKHLMKYIFEYLGQSNEDVEYILGNGQNILQLVYNPTIRGGDDSEALWTVPHTNNSAITLISPGTIPGLQILTNQGHWLPVLVPKGFLIVSTGLQMENKTAGLMKAWRHRAINPGGQYTRMERFVTEFLVYWNPNYTLSPFDNCVELMTRGMSKKRKTSYLKKLRC